MKETLSRLLLGERPQEEETDELLALNRETENDGLTLTRQEAAELARTRREALGACGRVEIGAETVEKLVLAFRGSAYLTSQNYAAVLEEATEAFYELKNESEETVSDDELAALLADGFERYGGKLASYLASPELDMLLRSRRYGAQAEEEDSENGEEPPDE